MPTRDLQTNAERIAKRLDRVRGATETELARIYNRALDDVRTTLARLYEQYRGEGELTRAQATQFLRNSNIESEIRRIMGPYVTDGTELMKEAASVSFQESYYRNAWAVNQATGVSQSWGLLDDASVRAAIGIGDAAGGTAALLEELGGKEAARHSRILDDAFRRYDADTRRWISRAAADGIIKGESVDRVARRIRREGIAKSYNSAQTIARTEINRATGLGSQVSYARGRDKGARIQEIWDATLDSRTRPDHAQADGAVMDEETGLFNVPWGAVPGPRRSGIPGQDINCRCTTRPQVAGYAPEVRRIRGQGMQPYQTFSEWAREQGLQRNRYGQRFRFLEE